ncbi:MAG: cyclase family protein, partial [Proteobacteria bacterium]|nr:cyclase family protein [Pseudomonadota bacterium]
DCDFLLVHTGWGTRWGTPEYYARWPSLAPDATIWLTRQGFKGIGLDTPSPDQDGDAALAAHHQLLGAGLVVVENLAHLDVLPQRGFTFMSLPLPLHGGDASPVRAVALVE